MMSGAVLGLDTSCYTTSAALVSEDGTVLASSRLLLPVPQGQRGLRQSEMVFLHTRQLPSRIEEALAALGDRTLQAVCASVRPRDDEASYMPAFQVGDAVSRSLAAVLRVPCFASTHQRGHIRAAMVESGIQSSAFVAVHLSGGTTDVLHVDGDSLTQLGSSLDLHAGQLVDRAGVMMALPFPSGPSLEALAVQGQAKALIPVSMEPCDLSCHISGAEARVTRWIQQGTMSREDIAAEIYDFLARTVSRMVLAASRETGASQALIAGGVASSALFRTLLTARIRKNNRDLRVCFGRPEYSGDNAVGVALIGLEKLKGASHER